MEELDVPVMATLAAQNKKPEYLFWVGCAGAYDDRYKKVSVSFARILNDLKTNYAILGTEETCTGDPARRAGNEMLFQMQALTVIETLKMYEVKKIITICPHCYNVFKNEYPQLGGHYTVYHATQFLEMQIEKGNLKFDKNKLSGHILTYHDPCYLGRANNQYTSPRNVLKSLQTDFVEVSKNKSYALCCGAGGAQMFKEAEKGDKEVFIERTEQLLQTGANIIASACPFCMTMFTDGIKYKNKEEEIFNYDIIELVEQAIEK